MSTGKNSKNVDCEFKTTASGYHAEIELGTSYLPLGGKVGKR